MYYGLLFFLIIISFYCFSQPLINHQELSLVCDGESAWGTTECESLLDEMCKSKQDVDLLSCISVINNYSLKDRYSGIQDYLKKLRSSDNECTRYEDSAYFEDSFSSYLRLKIDYNDYEKGAALGYLNSMRILASHQEYYNESVENRKKSLYWSLIYSYRINQKDPSYFELKEVRKQAYKNLNSKDVGEVMENFLGEIKSIDFESCS